MITEGNFDKDGKLKNPITSGPWEMRTLHRCEEEAGWIYFSGTRDSPIATNLYRVKLDGSNLERLTNASGSPVFPILPTPAQIAESRIQAGIVCRRRAHYNPAPFAGIPVS